MGVGVIWLPGEDEIDKTLKAGKDEDWLLLIVVLLFSAGLTLPIRALLTEDVFRFIG